MPGELRGHPEGAIAMEPAWAEVLARLAAEPWRAAFVVGGADSGKTTFCRALGERLAARRRTARIDCDPGQSAIGPPATVGLAWEPGADGALPVALRFVGSKSPAGHFLQTLTGIRRLLDHAILAGAKRVVLDASGYDGSGAGREFQFQAIDVVTPDHLVALQRGSELEPLLACFAGRAGLVLHRLPVPAAVVRRSPAARRAYRQARFAAYFEGARSQALDTAGLGFHGMVPDLGEERSRRQRLVALVDRAGHAAALGLVESFDPRRERLVVLAPAFDPCEVASVQFGSLVLSPDGREL